MTVRMMRRRLLEIDQVWRWEELFKLRSGCCGVGVVVMYGSSAETLGEQLPFPVSEREILEDVSPAEESSSSNPAGMSREGKEGLRE